MLGEQNRVDRDQSTIVEELVTALGRLDHRPVPPPEVFNPDAGQTMGFFLTCLRNIVEQALGRKVQVHTTERGGACCVNTYKGMF